jgi:hypothetical protein
MSAPPPAPPPSALRSLRAGLVIVGVVLSVLSLPFFFMAGVGLALSYSRAPGTGWLPMLIFLVPGLYWVGVALWLKSLRLQDPAEVEKALGVGSRVAVILVALIVGVLALFATCFSIVGVK